MSDMNIRNIDEKLLLEFKKIGLVENRPMREVVIEAMQKYVAEKQGVKKNAR